MKFVDSIPGDGRKRRAPVDFDLLLQHAGRWAEVERLPRAEADKLTQYCSRLNRREGIEATVRTVEAEAVLYVRAVAL